MFSNMNAAALMRTRLIDSELAFAELVLWQLPKPLASSTHRFKCRLAFTGSDDLMAAFQADIARWNHDNTDA